MDHQTVASLPWKEILYVIDLLLLGAFIALLVTLASEVLDDMRKDKAKRQKEEFHAIFERIDQESSK